MSFAFNVTLVDPGNDPNDAALLSITQSALNGWAQYLSGYGVIDVEITVASNLPPGSIGSGGSGTTVSVGTDGGRSVQYSSAAYELLTGNDANGSAPDIRITIDATYLRSGAYIDPAPHTTTPDTRQDLTNTINHELIHSFGVFGFRDYNTGALDPSRLTTWDQLVQLNANGTASFVGAHATSVFGRPVPVTTNTPGLSNYVHIGDRSTQISDFISVYRPDRTVFPISPLDIALLQDVGVPVSRGTAFNDYIIGSAASDNLAGGNGFDVLDGAGGADILAGGADNDIYLVDSATDSVIELPGEGFDTVLVSASFAFDIRNATGRSSGATNVEHLVYVGPGGGVLTGSDNAEALIGGAGNDTLSGLGARDYLFGAAGNDAVVGGAGDDYMLGGAGSDTFIETNPFGVDAIGDFTAGAGGDIIRFDALRSFAEVQSRLAQVDADGDGAADDAYIIIDATNTVALLNVAAGSLTSLNFSFV